MVEKKRRYCAAHLGVGNGKVKWRKKKKRVTTGMKSFCRGQESALRKKGGISLGTKKKKKGRVGNRPSELGKVTG